MLARMKRAPLNVAISTLTAGVGPGSTMRTATGGGAGRARCVAG